MRQRTIGGWTLGARLGHGGNAHVYSVTKDGKTAALKILRGRLTPKRLARFQDEVAAMQRCADIPGVLPIIEFHIPEPRGSEHAWLAMPRAQPIKEALLKHTLTEVVQAMRDIAQTLTVMHARGISHRDIKPENLFRRQAHWSLGDLGLADFEGKLAQTQARERIGAVHYIAPEMLNSADTSDGAPADVFSLAKTLWVLATGQAFPQPGPYDKDHPAYQMATFVTEPRASLLDPLIAAATVVEPQKRITMQQFAAELDAWLRPAPAAPPPIRLDLSAHVAELQRRHHAFASAQQRDQALQKRRNDAGLRLREKLRPLAIDVAESLRQAYFTFVTLNIDNFHYGFEINGTIPDPAGLNTELNITLSIDTSAVPEARISSRFRARRIANAQERSHALLWETQATFIESGSSESLALARLDESMRSELQHSVSVAAALAINAAEVAEGRLRAYTIWVHDPAGNPVENAQVVLVATDGTYLRDVTNQIGQAAFAPSAFKPSTVFIAHARFEAAFERFNGVEIMIRLKSSDATGSFVALRGWMDVEGFTGKVSFINDAHARKYMYADNIAINGGELQPVRIELGEPLRLTEQSVTATLIAKAVQGPAFLFDIRR
jgi:serine/threonine protein kinase